MHEVCGGVPLVPGTPSGRDGSPRTLLERILVVVALSCRARLEARTPPPEGYPQHPATLGRKFVRRRMDLGISQKEAAARLSVLASRLRAWERYGATPQFP